MENKYENIEILALDDIEDTYATIHSELEKLESKSDYIVLYAKRDLINDVFTHMIVDGFAVKYVDLDMMDNMLKNEVYLMLIDNHSLSIEPAYSKNHSIMENDAKTAIIFMDDCEQDIIDYCVNTDKNVILFDFSDENDESTYCECDSHKSVQCNNYKNNKNVYTIVVNGDIDTDRAKKVIADMRKHIQQINNMFAENDMFSGMFRW